MEWWANGWVDELTDVLGGLLSFVFKIFRDGYIIDSHLIQLAVVVKETHSVLLLFIL